MNNNDRRLLTWAAVAAGIDLVWVEPEYDGEGLPDPHSFAPFCYQNTKVGPHNRRASDHGPIWNPLEDNGDAFELAVKLDIHIQRVTTKEPTTEQERYAAARYYVVWTAASRSCNETMEDAT